MKKSAFIISLAAIIISAASCQKETMKPSGDFSSNSNSGLIFTATIENTGATKTAIESITGGYKVKWEDTDSISVNGVIYKATPDGSNPAKATFTKMRSGDDEPTAPFTVYYPASIYDSTSKKATLPQTQVYQADGNIAGILPMYAEGSDLTLQFKNLCGLLKFTLKGTEKVQHITLKDDTKALSGTFTVSDYAAVLDAGAKGGVTLDCGYDGVELDETTGKTFYVAVPAGSYENLRVEYSTVNYAKNAKKKANSTAVVERNKVYSFTDTPTFEVDYLCFTCTSGNVTIGMTKKDYIPKTGTPVYAPEVNLQYSMDKTEWQDFTVGSTSVALASGEKVYFKAKSTNNAFAASTSAYNYFTTATADEGTVDVSGNIMSLLNGSNPATTMTESNNYAFYNLFKGCMSIQKASDLSLPATTLAERCYMSMFNGCESLTGAPALPVTTLANNCYMSMFNGCTSLTEAPALPATTLANNCYASMFSGCASLTEAPALPATTLAEKCYNAMFSRCASLTSAPALPATTLVESCYISMFNGCTSLTQAPALPATTLAHACYKQMFDGCTDLTQAPVLNATKLIISCYYKMFSNCIKLSSVTILATADLNVSYGLDGWLDQAGSDGSVTSRTVYVAEGMVDAIKGYCPSSPDWKTGVTEK